MPKSSSKRGLVLVTGGSGFLAGNCIAELLNNGWGVRTTVRSVAKSKAVRAGIGDIAAKAAGLDGAFRGGVRSIRKCTAENALRLGTPEF